MARTPARFFRWELKDFQVKGLKPGGSLAQASRTERQAQELSVCPSFLKNLRETVGFLIPECEVSFHRSLDGSGQGVAMVTAVAARLSAHRRLLASTLAPFRLSREQLASVQEQMREAMARGLRGEASSLRMLPTYVRATPDGSGEQLGWRCWDTD